MTSTTRVFLEKIGGGKDRVYWKFEKTEENMFQQGHTFYILGVTVESVPVSTVLHEWF
jgi:hypothetical protein